MKISVLIIFFLSASVSMADTVEKAGVDIETLLGEAYGYFYDHDIDPATEIYQKVLKLDPDNIDAKFYLKRIKNIKRHLAKLPRLPATEK